MEITTSATKEIVSVIPGEKKHVVIACPAHPPAQKSVIDKFFDKENSIFVNDINGQLATQTAATRAQIGTVSLFAPLEENNPEPYRVSINPLADLPPGLEAKAQGEIIAASLIKTISTPSYTTNDFAESRKLITSLVLYVVHCEPPARRNLPRVYELLHLAYENERGNELGKLLENSQLEPEISAYLKNADNIDAGLALIKSLQALGREISTLPRELPKILTICSRCLHFLSDSRVCAALTNPTYSLNDFIAARRPDTFYFVAPQEVNAMVIPLFRLCHELIAWKIAQNFPEIN